MLQRPAEEGVVGHGSVAHGPSLKRVRLPSSTSQASRPASRERAPRRRPVAVIDQQPAREGADRAFDHAHVLIGNEAGDAGLPQHRLGEADQHGVVAAQHFTHGSG